MACPKCGCKVCYQYDDGDDVTPSTPDLERCSACGVVFHIEDHTDEDEEFDAALSATTPESKP